jgi:thiamine biosynthesis lipoprotein
MAALAVPCLAAPLWAEEGMSRVEALRSAFAGCDETLKHEVQIDAATRETLGACLGRDCRRQSWIYFEGRSGGRCRAYAVIDEVMGKHQMITYMAVFGPDLAVQRIEILQYREAYGGEIRQERFRRQFYGARPGSRLRLNTEIRNISGATISCRAITDAVNEQLSLLGSAAFTPSKPPRTSSMEEVRDQESKTAAGARIYRRAQFLMDTILDIQIAAPSRTVADHALQSAFDEVRRLEGLLSRFRPDSIVARINGARMGESVAVPSEVRHLLARCRQYAEKIRGRFDITMLPLIRLWEKGTPSSDEVENVMESVGSRYLRVMPDDTVVKERPGMGIDLGGVAKGFALSRAAEQLGAWGVRSALLNFGGQLYALEPPPGSRGWRTELRRPEDGGLLRVCGLRGASLATSGDTERARVTPGGVISHRIDCVRGCPARTRTTATVWHRDPEAADVWSTALAFDEDGGLANGVLGEGAGYLVISEESGLRSENFPLPDAWPDC